MSPISKFGLLALASTALAVPLEGHRHLHERQALRRPDVPRPDVPGAPDVPDVPDAADGAVGGAYGALSGKRGIAFNDASAALPYVNSPLFGWAFNWVSSPQGISNQVQFIPTLHNADPMFINAWAGEAQAAINAGAQYLFGFNEPDIASQANIDPKTAADLWRKHMEPFAGKAKLVAPAVSNSETPGLGLDWLKQFMSYCSDCTIDAVNQHWYDSTGNNIDYLKSKVEQAHSQTGLPVFLGEFAFIGDDNEISEALNQVMGWLDANDSVLGYAYFMAADGQLNDGGKPSPYGLTYLNN